jgi:hypothetical protein
MLAEPLTHAEVVRVEDTAVFPPPPAPKYKITYVFVHGLGQGFGGPGVVLALGARDDVLQRIRYSKGVNSRLMGIPAYRPNLPKGENPIGEVSVDPAYIIMVGDEDEIGPEEPMPTQRVKPRLVTADTEGKVEGVEL